MTTWQTMPFGWTWPTVVPRIKAEFQRAPSADVQSLTESVRSLEERLSRQKARLRCAEPGARESQSGRAGGHRPHECRVSRTVHACAAPWRPSKRVPVSWIRRWRTKPPPQIPSARASRTRCARSSDIRARLRERLRDTLVARDATIVQVLHSLGERDAQLNALQREHARLVPALEGALSLGREPGERLAHCRRTRRRDRGRAT